MLDWLNTYHELENRMNLIEYQIKRCENEHKRWRTFGTMQGDLAKSSKTLTSLTKQAELSELIEAYKLERSYVKREIEELRQLVDSFKGLDNEIIKLKYMDNMSLFEIAEELNYSYQHIKNKHSIIMKMIDFKYEDQGTI